MSDFTSGFKLKKKLLVILKNIKKKPRAKFSKISGHTGSHKPEETADRGIKRRKFSQAKRQITVKTFNLDSRRLKLETIESL